MLISAEEVGYFTIYKFHYIHWMLGGTQVAVRNAYIRNVKTSSLERFCFLNRAENDASGILKMRHIFTLGKMGDSFFDKI